jgi:hypothetical protein
MRKPKPGEFELVKIRGSGGAVFAVDLTPRVQKLIDRGEASLLAKAKRGRAGEAAGDPVAARQPEQDPAVEETSGEG